MYVSAAASVVDAFVDERKSGLIFTFGVTCSGKSYTVLGNEEQPGIIPRAVDRICEAIKDAAATRLVVSYMEVYNEQVYDLLVTPKDPAASSTRFNKRSAKELAMMPVKRKHLTVRDRGGKPTVERLTKKEVQSCDEAMQLILDGSKNRQCASTNLNSESSRSHSLCCFELMSKGESKFKPHPQSPGCPWTTVLRSAHAPNVCVRACVSPCLRVIRNRNPVGR